MLFQTTVIVAALFLPIDADVLGVQQLGNLWNSYKKKEGKHYINSTEDEERRAIFSRNLQHIVLHNLDADLGVHNHKLGINPYADIDHKYFLKTMTGLIPDLARKAKAMDVYQPDYSTPVPEGIDWRDNGIVTPVKNQAGCGACWSFAAVGALEAHFSKASGTLVQLSDQQVLDCAGDEYGNQGCTGGLPDNAYRYIIDAGGVVSDFCYPYEEEKGECRFQKDCVAARMSDYVDIPQGDEQALTIALATEGPLSVGVDAGQPDFQLYMSGIYNPDQCSQQVNHAVLLVGYGSEDGVDYWTLKNSWGTSWGEEGYFRLVRNANNKCGISNLASYPKI